MLVMDGEDVWRRRMLTTATMTMMRNLMLKQDSAPEQRAWARTHENLNAHMQSCTHARVNTHIRLCLSNLRCQLCICSCSFVFVCVCAYVCVLLSLTYMRMRTRTRWRHAILSLSIIVCICISMCSEI